jgi:hypothetical protein
MTSEDLIELLAERPFIPLRIHLSNGRTHEIRHPEMAIVGAEVVAVGVQREGDTLPRIRILDVRHINEVEPVPHSAQQDEPDHRD